jgi:hypothetical protein
MKRAGTAIILLSAVAAAGLWIQPAPRPPAPEPAPAAWTLDPRDAPHLLEQFIDRHERAANVEAESRFDREKKSGITEARLLALALPETMEPLLERIAGDTARSARARDFAARILGFLPDADAALVRLAPRSAPARRELCRRDFRGAHLAIYLAAGDAEALSHWTDPQAIEALRRLAAVSDDGPWINERLGILLTLTWFLRVEEILGEACHEQNYLTPWALQLARSRALPGLASTLRHRIDTAISDEFQDDVLLALSDLGAELTKEEQARLEEFGYLGDPAARLAELLGHR